MGQQLSFSDEVHIAICNCRKDELAHLMLKPEFSSDIIDERMLVELIQKQWDNAVIYKFAQSASDDQLASLVAAAILHNHVISLDQIFSKMKAPRATIERHHLQELFLTVCDRCNVEAAKTLVEFQCYDPQDERPIVSVFRTAMRKNFAVEEELLDEVLKALPNHTETARYLLNCLPLEARQETIRDQLKEKLEAYLASCAV